MTGSYAEVAAPEPCVMELVSRLAREPWTDRPSCVHPVLGAIARAAHDHSTPAGRRALLPLAPQFLDTARPGLGPAARLAALCVSTALACPGRITRDERVRLTHAHETALYLLTGQGTAGWWLPVLGRLHLSEPFYRTFAAPEHAAEAVAVTARATAGNHDAKLRQLVKLCLRTHGARRPGAPSPSWSTSPAPQRL